MPAIHTIPNHEQTLIVSLPQYLLFFHESPFVSVYNFMSIPSVVSPYAVGDTDGTTDNVGDILGDALGISLAISLGITLGI